MRLESDAQMSLWLANFVPVPDSFDWDEGNSDKSAIKHGFSDEEIESIMKSRYVFAGHIIKPRHAEWRGLILNWTHSGKQAALIFTCRGKKLRPISCRPMREWERRKYAEKTGS